jgi:hypothetical protein
MWNLKKYTGPLAAKPTWNCVNFYDANNKSVEVTDHVIKTKYIDYKALCCDDVLSPEQCQALISDFEAQPSKYPVGVDGYGDPSANIGSWRAMAWADGFDAYMSTILDGCLADYRYLTLERDGSMSASWGRSDEPLDFMLPFSPEQKYELLGSTPWMRFMKYSSGGKHVPHYDAPFINESEKYITLYSWVLYLNDLDGEGGHFQFVKDGQEHLAPADWKRDDWTRQATADEIIHSIQPKAGRLLIFPHWLCHQVQEFVGNGHRYIIRGDVAYGF